MRETSSEPVLSERMESIRSNTTASCGRNGMNVSETLTALEDRNPIVFGLMFFNYDFENHADCGTVCNGWKNRPVAGVLTPASLAELMVKFLKSNTPDIAERNRSALVAIPNLVWSSNDGETGIVATRIRSEMGVRLPDAVQLASARVLATPTDGCFLTNDRHQRNGLDVDVFLREELLAK